MMWHICQIVYFKHIIVCHALSCFVYQTKNIWSLGQDIKAIIMSPILKWSMRSQRCSWSICTNCYLVQPSGSIYAFDNRSRKKSIHIDMLTHLLFLDFLYFCLGTQTVETYKSFLSGHLVVQQQELWTPKNKRCCQL